MAHHRIKADTAILAVAFFCSIPLAKATSPLVEGMVVTPDARAQQAAICPSGTGYPLESEWASRPANLPSAATSGQPLIQQYRNGTLIANYTSFSDQPGCTQAGDGTDYLNPAGPAATGCGPFTREHSYRMWAPGDVFYVYPAVYAGEYNQPWIGPEYDSYPDYVAGISHTPDNITIRGVVQNNMRPVILMQGAASNNTLGQAALYFDQSTGIVWDNIDVAAGAKVSAGKAGVYELGASNLTLSNMRINGFERAGVNGLFGAGQYSGSLTLDFVELDHNGGTNGPAHNAYIGASAVDPNFTVNVSHSWSHDAYYGHLFKSRAQNNNFTANFFQGRLPQPGQTQSETYLLDIPNGGNVTVRNNIFVKNASGAGSNGMSFTFMMEGATDNRSQSVDVENNTFVAFAKTFDGTNPVFPFAFLYPSVVPNTPAWPSNIPVRVLKNAFVGYCTASQGPVQNYRGNVGVIESFVQLSRTFALRSKVYASDAQMSALYPDYTPEVGTPSYNFLYGATPARTVPTIGAEN